MTRNGTSFEQKAQWLKERYCSDVVPSWPSLGPYFTPAQISAMLQLSTDTVIRMLAGASRSVDTSTVATAVRYPTQTTRRALEDLAAHGVVRRQPRGQGKADDWRLSGWTTKKCTDADVTFPEMSEEENGETFTWD